MKKIIILGFFYLAMITFNCSVAADNQNEIKKKVFINQITNHPALDITAKGIIDGLKNNGYEENKNLEIKLESAQADTVLSSQIASKFANQNSDVVVGIGTVSSQSFLKYTKNKKVKLVFASVTDPLKAGLVKTLNKPENNTSGVSNFIALEPQIKLFKEIQPELKKLGFIYNPAEANSISLIETLEKILPLFDIKLVIQSANKTSDVPQATIALLSKVDAIFIHNDNTALSALQSIINISNKEKKPIYVGDIDSVELGAIAALGPNQYQVGLQAGNIISDVLKGKNINEIPVQFVEKTDLYLNENAAKKLGISFSEDLKKQASKIINKNGEQNDDNK